MNRIKRLTMALESVITSIFGGRRDVYKGDSKTPISDSIEYNDSLHYSNRHGLHLNPTKKRRFKTLDNTEEMNDLF